MFIEPMNVTLGSRSGQLLHGAKWRGRDKYPAWQCFADELELLLTFAEAQGEFDRFSARLRADQRERNSALAELRVAVALTNRGFTIAEWEPLGASQKRGEFLVQAPLAANTFVEVKAPDWHGEITGFSDVSRNPERQRWVEARKRQPKYRNGGGGAHNPASGVEFAITKAYPKFATDRSNLLVIPSDDLFISYQHEPALIADLCLFNSNGLFTDDRYNHLGAVALFWYECRRDVVVYEMETFANPHALPGVALSATALQRLHQQLPRTGNLRVSFGSHSGGGHADFSR